MKKENETTNLSNDENRSQPDFEKSSQSKRQSMKCRFKLMLGSALNGIKFIRQRIFLFKQKRPFFCKLSLIVTVVVLIVIFVLIVTLASGRSNSEKTSSRSTAPMQQQAVSSMQEQSWIQLQNQALKKMQDSLVSVQHQLTSMKKPDVSSQLSGQLSQLEQSLSHLKQSMSEMKSQNQQGFVAVKHSDLINQRQAKKLEDQLKSIQGKLTKQHYLPADILPFMVLSKGYWGTQLMVTVAIKDINGGYHYRLMGQGQQFSCSGQQPIKGHCQNWILKKVSNVPPEAIFVNTDHPSQRVKVDLS